MKTHLTRSCLRSSEMAQELPESTVLTAPLGQLWSQDCYPPESDFILHRHDILGDCILKQQAVSLEIKKKTESKKADLFKGAGGNGEVSGELKKSKSLRDKTTVILPASLKHTCTYWFCFSGEAWLIHHCFALSPINYVMYECFPY